MKNVKKLLAVTALSGAVLVGAGAGTYSWFTSSSTATGTIVNGTLALNDNTDIKGDYFSRTNFAPSQNEVGDVVEFKNTGSLPMVVKLNYVDEVSSGGLWAYGGWIYGSITNSAAKSAAATEMKYEINGKGDAMQAKSAAEKRVTSLPELTLQPGQILRVYADITLNSAAGNEYQGATYTAVFEGKAKQTDAGAKFTEQ